MKKLIAICVVIVLCCSSTTVFALQKQSIIQSDDDNKTISQSDFDDSITMPRSLSAKDNFIFRILEKLLAIIPPILIAMFLLLT
ncbi:MAG: hypothetical protein KAW45_08385 [Thermoplasmatales archaeon]|nr:hypothetical protein [Thermoplasmatales archaeon]